MTSDLVMPANRIGPNARFLRLFISSVIAAITSSNVQPAHRVAFLLDELRPSSATRSRSRTPFRRCAAMAWPSSVFIQDLSQLKRPYPKW